MKRILPRIVGACLCVALVSSMVVTPVAAQTDEERVLVELGEEGDADVSVTFAYDLSSEEEGTAFEQLQENTTAQAEATERFENRMGAVADDASAVTDRDMSVTDSAIELRRDGDAGLVTLSLRWTNLAAVDGDRLTVTEPFASGFEPDREFSVVVPDGYEIASATPEPSGNDGTSVTWDADSSLDGFELVAETGAAGTDEESGSSEASEESLDGDGAEDAAGFGAVTAVLALLAAALLAVRGRR